MKNQLVAPVVKWVGGKRQLMDEIISLLPSKVTNYCEPFVGGGAVLFGIQPKKAIVNDINSDLIELYELIKTDVEAIITKLQEFKNERDFFYEVRDWDRDKEKYSLLPAVDRAARFIYLNKTCYNGLYRVNNAGEFNVPFGNYKNPNIVNAPTLRAVSKYFNDNSIQFFSEDYKNILGKLKTNTFVYIDPPYDPVSTTSNFTGYTSGGFDRDEQIQLRKACDILDSKGIKFMLSNSATQFIKEQYSNYDIRIVHAKRAINSNANRRGDVDEVIVRNYE